MKYQIDQSGKIEQTRRNSVVALTNGKNMTILLKKKEKRKLQEFFKSAKQQRYFPYLTFAVLVAIIINGLKLKQKVVIDKEYFGNEQFIEEHILLYLQILGTKTFPVIEFGHVGKLSNAHQLAYLVAVEKKKPNFVINSEEVIRILFGTKKVLFGTKKSGFNRLTQE